MSFIQEREYLILKNMNGGITRTDLLQMPVVRIAWYHGQVLNDLKAENDNKADVIDALHKMLKMR